MSSLAEVDGSAIPFPHRVPFVQLLGFSLHAAQAGESDVRLDLRADHLNAWSVAHGGVLMTMLDACMAHAARSMGNVSAGNGIGVVTLEMKTTFMRPAEGLLRARGRVLHRTATLAFCEAGVNDEAGELCAHATGTFKFLRGLPTRDGKARALEPLSPVEEP